jgi:hypothetical protein
MNWRDGANVVGLEDLISASKVSLAPGTNVATYWPSVVFQDSSGTLIESYFNYSGPNQYKNRNLLISGSPGSPLLALPLESQNSAGQVTPAPSMRMVYRAQDGRLTLYDRDRNGTQMPTSGKLPSLIPMPTIC